MAIWVWYGWRVDGNATEEGNVGDNDTTHPGYPVGAIRSMVELASVLADKGRVYSVCGIGLDSSVWRIEATSLDHRAFHYPGDYNLNERNYNDNFLFAHLDDARVYEAWCRTSKRQQNRQDASENRKWLKVYRPTKEG